MRSIGWPIRHSKVLRHKEKGDFVIRPSVDDYFGDWKQREALVQEMIPVIGRLFSQRNVGIFIYGRPLHNRSVTFIMKSHRFVRQVERNEMSEFESHPMLMELAKLDLWNAQIDIGKLTVRYMEHLASEADKAVSVAVFVKAELGYLDGVNEKPVPKSQDVLLYGSGRIGRLMARLLIERTSNGEVMRLKAIVVRPRLAAQNSSLVWTSLSFPRPPKMPRRPGELHRPSPTTAR